MNKIFNCVRFFEASEEPLVHLGQLKRFSLRELLDATDGFSEENILGRGLYGKVYKGRLANGSVVAVKRLKGQRTPDEDKQFQTEVKMVSMAVHRNLLRLLGYCMTPTERLLVYPIMVNRSVQSRLTERIPSEPPLDWPTRMRIALGSARGLSYLHDHCNPKIIHRNVKAAVIFLDEELEAIVGVLEYDDNHVCSAVCGTLGNIAPEYIATGKASEKSDVYGYGILLLELISGQRASDLALRANAQDVILRAWVKGLVNEKKLELLVDPNLQSNYVEIEVKQLVELSLLCTQGSPMDRPKMSEVVSMLEGRGWDERWDDWQEEEGLIQQAVEVREAELQAAAPHANTRWTINSISYLEADELSGPR